jgi:hypothetical protein
MTKDHFDPEQAEQILSFLRAGAFPHVAAEAAGLQRQVFRRWLKSGEKKRAREPFRTFAREVRKACAQARLRAELAAWKLDPKFWLKYGPGRELPDCPGWTGETRAGSCGDPAAEDLALHPQWNQLCALLLGALDPFPEARFTLAEMLKKK